jgi:hypothetical protein
MMFLGMRKKVKRRSEGADELARLHERFAELLAAKDQWRSKKDQAFELPHVGRKAFVSDPQCDAPPGACRRCQEWAEANLAHLDAVTAFNRVARELAAYSQTVRARRGRDLSNLKGDSSRKRTLAAALKVFGERKQVRLGALLIQIPHHLGGKKLTERTIRRHLEHPGVASSLEKEGKKIV